MTGTQGLAVPAMAWRQFITLKRDAAIVETEELRPILCYITVK